MPRDNILDEAAQNEEKNGTSDGNDPESETDETTDGAQERERLTQRTPVDLLDDVDTVQEKYRLPNRNATINFMLGHAADDLLDKE